MGGKNSAHTHLAEIPSMRGVSIGILAAMLAFSRADDVLSDGLEDGVELMIHLDFSHTDRVMNVIT